MQAENEVASTQKSVKQKKKFKLDKQKNSSAIYALKKNNYASAKSLFAELLPLSEIEKLLASNPSPSPDMCALAFNYGLACLQSYQNLQKESDLPLAELLFQLSQKLENKNSKSWQRSLWVIKTKLFEVFRLQLDLYLTTNVAKAESVFKKILTECKDCIAKMPTIASSKNEKGNIIYDLISEFISKACTEADNASKKEQILIASTYYLLSIEYISFQQKKLTELATKPDLELLEAKKADIFYNLMDMNRSSNLQQVAKTYASLANNLYTKLFKANPTNENYRSGYELTNAFIHDIPISLSENQTDDNQVTNSEQSIVTDVNENSERQIEQTPTIADDSPLPLIVPEPGNLGNANGEIQDMQEFITDLNIEDSILLKLDISTLNAINKQIQHDIETSSTAIKETEERILQSASTELNRRYTKLSELNDQLVTLHMLSENDKKDLAPISQTVSEYQNNKVQFAKKHFPRSTQTVKAQLERAKQDIESVTEMINDSQKKKRKITAITAKIGLQASWKKDLPVNDRQIQIKDTHLSQSTSRKKR